MVVVKSEIRADIVSVARKVFSRKGFRQTTMDEIARAARMGKSSIYYYYKSKEDIFEAVVVKEAQELKRQLIKVISSGNTPIDRLRDYIMFRLYHVKTVSNFYAALNEDDLGQMKFVKRVREKFEEEEFKMVRDVLERGMSDGAFVINNAEIGAMAFTTMLKGLELPLFLNKLTRTEKEKLLDELVRVIFYGIVKRES
ncbi:MAG: helix-turn-helix domain containing protein [Bacteroidales bacterium]|nr:helix-turn-helix domain containing protein [Bacteroidales bacterium]MDT8431203.1 helix-turn-helix domain-containing protein [Bacteroidales bacterium]